MQTKTFWVSPVVCSVTLGRYVSSAAEVYQQAATLLAGLRVPVEEIRGVGITVSMIAAAKMAAVGSGSSKSGSTFATVQFCAFGRQK